MTTWPILLIFLGASVALTAEERKSFQSILIERACLKHPTLEFCAPIPQLHVIPPSTTPPLLVVPPTTTTTPSPLDTVDFEMLEAAANETRAEEEEHEMLGSLVKLPKPANAEPLPPPLHETDEHHQEAVDTPSSDVIKNTTMTIETEKGVLVFVSEYCVIEREHFVKTCHGTVEKSEEQFCKSYVSACTSASGVLPVMTYCARYYTHYPKHCKSQLVEPSALQFCFAFEQFCLPEKSHATAKPKSNLKRCEQVLPEARKVCSPFPKPTQTFDLVRCTHFFTTCRKFVDWVVAH